MSDSSPEGIEQNDLITEELIQEHPENVEIPTCGRHISEPEPHICPNTADYYREYKDTYIYLCERHMTGEDEDRYIEM